MVHLIDNLIDLAFKEDLGVGYYITLRSVPKNAFWTVNFTPENTKAAVERVNRRIKSESELSGGGVSPVNVFCIMQEQE